MVMFTIEELTPEGWANATQHRSREMAFWHARAKSDADGHTYRMTSETRDTLCLLTAKGSECWDMEDELVA